MLRADGCTKSTVLRADGCTKSTVLRAEGCMKSTVLRAEGCVYIYICFAVMEITFSMEGINVDDWEERSSKVLVGSVMSLYEGARS